MIGVALAEKGFIPDFLVRLGIRARLKATLKSVSDPNEELARQRKADWIQTLKESPIALVPEVANEQHYELPPPFFQHVLGERLKYSSGYWPEAGMDLNESEVAMLKLSCQRAELEDGLEVLELGCGWGSLSLWMAENYPKSKILAVSNSRDQKKFIEGQMMARGITNLTIQTADMNDFQTDRVFDRVVSIEMFEHMRNYEQLMSQVSGWLNPGGKLFIHIFTHRDIAYPYVDNGPKDWMTRFFFTGGQMPSADLLPQFAQDKLNLEDQWKVNGVHYQRTSRAWLEKMDQEIQQIKPLFEETYGAGNTTTWVNRWRLFFMACEELFGFNNGDEWFVSHYRFKKI